MRTAEAQDYIEARYRFHGGVEDAIAAIVDDWQESRIQMDRSLILKLRYAAADVEHDLWLSEQDRRARDAV